VPLRIDLKTGEIYSQEKKVFRFSVRFRNPEIEVSRLATADLTVSIYARWRDFGVSRLFMTYGYQESVSRSPRIEFVGALQQAVAWENRGKSFSGMTEIGQSLRC
jgi:hypothetical protein